MPICRYEKVWVMMKTIGLALRTAGHSSSAGSMAVLNPRPPAARHPQGKSHFVSFNGNKIHYVTAGAGSHTIVFVHCWAGNLGFWREQVPALADKARLVLIDLPGHGQSDSPLTGYGMDYFAGAVLSVMQDARVDQATLIGHSMGGP